MKGRGNFRAELAEQPPNCDALSLHVAAAEEESKSNYDAY